MIAGGSIVGIVMQSLDEAENVGYMIPVPIITHFLDDVADGDAHRHFDQPAAHDPPGEGKDLGTFARVRPDPS